MYTIKNCSTVHQPSCLVYSRNKQLKGDYRGKVRKREGEKWYKTERELQKKRDWDEGEKEKEWEGGGRERKRESERQRESEKEREGERKRAIYIERETREG